MLTVYNPSLITIKHQWLYHPYTEAQRDGEMLIVQEDEGLGVVLALVGRIPGAPDTGV